MIDEIECDGKEAYMNIPRRFYGINYLSGFVSHFQDTDLLECPRLEFHALEHIKEIPLERRDTASLGLNAGILSELFQKIFSDRRCGLDGIAIARRGKLLCSRYRLPYTEEIPRITNSTCKTVTAIGIQFAISEGRLKEEDTVLSFFPEYATILTPRAVKQMTIKHLLTMTSGTKCSEFTSVIETNWAEAFLMTDCEFEPGSRFVYNSMNTYMLAAILTRVTGQSVMEYLRERFFEPLGINHVKWELCPKGIERGGWGLHITLEDMIKIGMFLAKNGNFQGRQLIDASYICKMKEKAVSQDADSLAVGYGCQLWNLPKGLYMLSGMYGQHVIVDEQHGMVVATNAHCEKMFPDSKMVRYLLKYLTNEALYQPESRQKERHSYRKLMQELQAFCNDWPSPGASLEPSFFLYTRKQNKRQQAQRKWIDHILSHFYGRRLHIDQTSIKLFPYMLQGMYQCPPFMVTDIAFQKYKDHVRLCFYKERSKKDRREKKRRECLVIDAGLAQYHYQTVPIGRQGDRQVAARIFPATDEDGYTVILFDLVFLAEGFRRRIKFFPSGDRIAVECQEYPDMRGIADQVLYGDTVIAGSTIDLTDKLPEGIRVFLEYKVEPRVNAYLVERNARTG